MLFQHIGKQVFIGKRGISLWRVIADKSNQREAYIFHVWEISFYLGHFLSHMNDLLFLSPQDRQLIFFVILLSFLVILFSMTFMNLILMTFFSVTGVDNKRLNTEEKTLYFLQERDTGKDISFKDFLTKNNF